MTIRTNPLHYTVPEFLKGATQVNLRRHWPLMLLSLAAALALQWLTGWTAATIAYILVFGIAVPLCRPFLAVSNKKFKRRLLRPVVLEFDETHMRVLDHDDLISKTKLDDADRAYRVAEAWVLKFGRMQEYMVPIRIFKSPEDLAAFEFILRQNNLTK